MNEPRLAIIDTNTLAAIGMRQLLQQVMPFMNVDTFGSFAELQANNPDSYVHYFVSLDILLNNRPFFSEHQRKTIVLTIASSQTSQLAGFHSLCINQSEHLLIRQLLQLEQHAHADGRHLPPSTHVRNRKLLTDREIEVIALIAQGYINKEIADNLQIGVNTVITHRKNIMEKLGVRSVSALTIYAVMNGYVDINRI